MTELYKMEQEKERVILVGVQEDAGDDTEKSLEELSKDRTGGNTCYFYSKPGECASGNLYREGKDRGGRTGGK